MPCIVTTVHDPAALAATCRRLSLSPPQYGTIQLDDKEVSDWIVRLPGVRFPIVCDTLTGLIAYHPSDNVFSRYARVMRFVYYFYVIQARLRQANGRPESRRSVAPMFRRQAVVAQGH